MSKSYLNFLKLLVSRFSPSTHHEDGTREIANRIYLNRKLLNREGDAHNDWIEGERIYKSPLRRMLFWINQRLIAAEKKAVEPVADWVDKADLFRIIERISPAIEALGVIAIPFVLFFAGQQYQERLRLQESERLQQQAIKDYLNQLSTIFLDAKSDLRDPNNEQLRTLTTATTLTLLREPNLAGTRKGQIVRFLSQMNLINGRPVSASQQEGDGLPTLPLRNADLRGADLRGADLRGADLRGAELVGASLRGADLRSAILRGADLRDADLFAAKLNRADLRLSNLNGADLSGANLSNVNLQFASLISADLFSIELEDAILDNVTLRDAHNLENKHFQKALLCKTQLPKSIDLNSDRDCKEIEELDLEPLIQVSPDNFEDE